MWEINNVSGRVVVRMNLTGNRGRVELTAKANLPLDIHALDDLITAALEAREVITGQPYELPSKEKKAWHR